MDRIRVFTGIQDLDYGCPVKTFGKTGWYITGSVMVPDRGNSYVMNRKIARSGMKRTICIASPIQEYSIQLSSCQSAELK